MFGKNVGRTVTVCLDDECPVHTNHQPRETADPPPTIPAAPEEETEKEAAQRRAEHEQRMAEYEAEQQRREEERKAEYERQQKEYEAEQARREKQRKARLAIFERILEHTPASFNAAQMRFFLRLVIQLDYSFLEDVATHFANGDENEQRTDEEIVLAALDGTTDEKLTSLALRIVLSDHVGIPHESQPDLLSEAELVFVPTKPKVAKTKARASSKEKPAAVKASPKEGGLAEESRLGTRSTVAPDLSGAVSSALNRKSKLGETPFMSLVKHGHELFLATLMRPAFVFAFL
jgi:ParB family chromosome partitioning protein